LRAEITALAKTIQKEETIVYNLTTRRGNKGYSGMKAQGNKNRETKQLAPKEKADPLQKRRHTASSAKEVRKEGPQKRGDIMALVQEREKERAKSRGGGASLP